MVELELPKNPTRRQKQPISIPFVWETKPGTPKNDWQPVRPSRPPPPPPCHQPIKLIASVPFEWEEKPGIPLPSYEHNSGSKDENDVILERFTFQNNESFHDERDTIFKSDFETFSFKTEEPPCHNPPIKLIASVPFEWEEEPGKPLASFPFSPPFHSRYADENENNSGDDDENEMISDSDFETLSFHTDDSCSSVPSLLANCFVPAVAIANAIPVLETPPSPPGYESDSSTCSYATGTTSLVGAPFLEKLFPLLTPKSNFLENAKSPKEKENNPKDHQIQLPSKDSVCESSFNGAKRRPTTLGELIMMSRRRSYVRKAVQIRTHNSSMEDHLYSLEYKLTNLVCELSSNYQRVRKKLYTFKKSVLEGSMKKGGTGCFMFDINNKIEGLQRKMKRQLQLKLI